ncbi:hypothetical protein ACG02S_10435 [Roseateles sp. DC23W]|uniref:Protein TolA n=1 Tax=Pelomonas dachongensis TaxID=3299029 RepID=A0ABW7EQL0_9BURK
MKPTPDVAKANRIRWFLAAHLLAVLGLFEASLWVGEHLAAKPDPIPAAPGSQRVAAERPQPQQFAREDSLAGRQADDGDAGPSRPSAEPDAGHEDRLGGPATRLP